MLALGIHDFAKDLDHQVQKIAEAMYVENQLDVKAILEEQQKRKQAEMALKDK